MTPPSPLPLSPVGWFFVTSGGLGTLRPAPGTWGSLPPIGLAGLLILGGIVPTGKDPSAGAIYHTVLLTLCAMASLGCIAFGPAAEVRWGKKDPSSVVADETAGQCLPLLGLPAASFSTTPRLALTLALAFVSFRIFDILKLPPAYSLQRLRGGWGILVDDLVAGVQTLIVVQLVTRLAF
ncbi:MAG: phosphatidylglycerophosphatase A [Phycisphaeraceae bacterium]|nr:phosphatidylglycerophosphatase A [Phycisphaeraceae bacterium]